MSNTKLFSVAFTVKELEEMLANVKAGGTAEVLLIIEKQIVLR